MLNSQIVREISSLQVKWKNIKQDARKRDSLIRKALNQTGGGQIKQKDKRIMESQLYADVANKMGLSSSGNNPRFDCDQSNSMPQPPKRLRSALSLDADDGISMQSNSSFSHLGLSAMALGNTAHNMPAVRNQVGSGAFSQLTMLQPSDATEPVPMTSTQARIMSSAQSLAQVVIAQSHEAPVSATTSAATSATPTTSTSSASSSVQASTVPSVPTTAPSTVRLQNRANSLQSPPRIVRNNSTTRVASNIRDVQMQNADLMREHLTQQSENNLLQQKYLKLQVTRAEMASEKEKVSLEREKILLEKEKILLEREKLLLAKERNM